MQENDVRKEKLEECFEKIQDATDVTTRLNLFRQLIRESGYEPKIVESALYAMCLLHPEYKDDDKALIVLSEDNICSNTQIFIEQIIMKFPDIKNIDIRTFGEGYFEVDENEYCVIFLSTDLDGHIIDHLLENFEDESVYLISERYIFDVK